MKDKLDVLAWVISTVAAAKDEFLTAADEKNRRPLAAFLTYYLFGRDSVACNILSERFEEISNTWKHSALSQDEKDLKTFWTIVGLIEIGSVEKAEKLMKSFHPSDARLLLAIHLGCFLLQHVRISSKQVKHCAERIRSSLEGHIKHLREEILKEFKSELLEIRKGSINAVESQDDTANA